MLLGLRDTVCKICHVDSGSTNHNLFIDFVTRILGSRRVLLSILVLVSENMAYLLFVTMYPILLVLLAGSHQAVIRWLGCLLHVGPHPSPLRKQYLRCMQRDRRNAMLNIPYYIFWKKKITHSGHSMLKPKIWGFLHRVRFSANSQKLLLFEGKTENLVRFFLM